MDLSFPSAKSLAEPAVSTEIIDLKLSKKIENTDFYFKITNLLDDHYQKPHGYNQEGRVIKLGFKN